MEPVETSGLDHVLQIASRHRVLLLLVPLVAALVGYGTAKMQTPRYEATAILLAGQGGKAVGDIDQVQSANQAALALGTMASDRVVLEHALRDVDDDDTSLGELIANTRTSVPADSQKIEVTVSDPDPARAARLANAVAGSFAALIADREATRFNLGATVWQRAIRPQAPVSPNVPFATIAALLIGILLAGALAVARETLDSTWRSERDVETDLDQAVLAVIPQIRTRHRRHGAAS
jgi:capsular polysaccharide biosynthesis protein